MYFCAIYRSLEVPIHVYAGMCMNVYVYLFVYLCITYTWVLKISTRTLSVSWVPGPGGTDLHAIPTIHLNLDQRLQL